MLSQADDKSLQSRYSYALRIQRIMRVKEQI